MMIPARTFARWRRSAGTRLPPRWLKSWRCSSRLSTSRRGSKAGDPRTSCLVRNRAIATELAARAEAHSRRAPPRLKRFGNLDPPALLVQHGVPAPELQPAVGAFARVADEGVELLLRNAHPFVEIGGHRAEPASETDRQRLRRGVRHPLATGRNGRSAGAAGLQGRSCARAAPYDGRFRARWRRRDRPARKAVSRGGRCRAIRPIRLRHSRGRCSSTPGVLPVARLGGNLWNGELRRPLPGAE